MQLLSYGYQLPQTGDPAVNSGGTGWFTQIAYDITRLNGHSHNGVDSASLSISSIGGLSVVAPAANWTVSGSGYSQSVTAPPAIGDIINYLLVFYVNTAGARFGQKLELSYSRTGTGNTFTLFCNDNTVDVLCLFR